MRRDIENGNFVIELKYSLKDHIIKLLPKGTQFLWFDRNFEFIRRTNDGDIFHIEVNQDLINLITYGLDMSKIIQTQVTHENWKPDYGIAYAPNGTYVEYTTPGSYDYDDYTSYGIVSDKRYKKLAGTNWYVHNGYYRLWKGKPCGVTVSEYGGETLAVTFEGKKHHAFLVEKKATFDHMEIANKLNELTANDKLFVAFAPKHAEPSPDYYDISRWKKDGNDWKFE